ncbi:hypothetical protein ACLKA7_008000 [Drosophila subpalustris]
MCNALRDKPGNALPRPQLGFVEFQLSKLAMEDLKLIFIWAHVKLIMRHGKIGTEPKAATRAQWGKLKQSREILAIFSLFPIYFKLQLLPDLNHCSWLQFDCEGNSKNPSPRTEPPLD